MFIIFPDFFSIAIIYQYTDTWFSTIFKDEDKSEWY